METYTKNGCLERMESLMTKSHLKEMEKMVLSSDGTIEEKNMNFQSFKKFFGKFTPASTTEEEMRNTFEKIDIYCEGKISLEQYLDYLMNESLSKDMIHSYGLYQPFREEAKTVKTLEGDELEFIGDFKSLKLPRNDTIKEIIYYETQGPEKSDQDVGTGQYVTISERGVLDFWSSDFRMINRLNALGDKYKHLRVTAMTTMENANMIVISTNLRDIRFYFRHPFLFAKKYEIVGFWNSIICMDYAVDPEDFKHGYLVIGNDNGRIGYFNLTECEVGAPFGVNHLYKLPPVTRFKEIKNWKGPNIKFTRLNFSYGDWVQQVKYIEPINSIISCAADISCSANSRVSLCIHPINKKVHYEFKVKRGILCFDYCYIQNLIITGGMDYSVRIWNPYVTNKAYAILLGHTSPIMKVFMDSKRHLAFSVSIYKFIFVWDIERQEAVLKFDGNFMNIVRTYSTSNVSAAAVKPNSAFYNPKSNTILIGSNNLEIFRSPYTEYHKIIRTHQNKIINVLISDKFEYVVSGSHRFIKVWNLHNGAKILEFQPTTRKMIRDGDVITSMALDESKKRLATGTKFGCIKTWNFCNGALLVELSTKDRKEIAEIIISDNKIFTVGKDRRVTVFDDNKQDSMRIWRIAHKEDISSVASYWKTIIATSSYDGNIVLWSIETGYIKHRLHDERKLDDVERMTEQELRTIKRNQPHFTGINETLNLPKNPYASIHNILFLQNRQQAPDVVNFLATGKDGYIRGWCIHAECTLLVRFFGAERRRDSVISMKSNTTNKYLLTGDTSGYISVWYLNNFYNNTEEYDLDKELKSFTYTKILPDFLETKDKIVSKEVEEDYYLLGKPPVLLNRFRGHLTTVYCLEFVDNYEYIITGSTDHSIRIWTLNGRFLGTFGDKIPWNLDEKYLITAHHVIPEDVKRCGSPLTLRVLSGGMSRLWKVFFNTMRFLFILLGIQRRQVAAGKIIKEIEFAKKEIYEDNFFEFKLPKYILGKYYTAKSGYTPTPNIDLISNDKEVFPFMTLPIFELEKIDLPDTEMTATRLSSTAPNVIKWKKSVSERKKDKPKLKKK